MSVRAKFTVQSITRAKGWGDHAEVHTIHLLPVTSGSDEDKSFFAATASGKIELGVVRLEAGSYFKLGQSYYVDFTEAV